MMPVTEHVVRDLSDLSDDQWRDVLRRSQSADERAKYIMHSVLIENAHYGNPLGVDNKPLYDRKILYLAGAEKLQKTLKLEYFVMSKDTETEVIAPTLDPFGKIIDPGFVSVTCHRGLMWWNGTVISEHSSNCNSRESRFEGADGGWRYDDAREVLNECLFMARKRVKVHLVCDVTGLRAYLQTEEEMEKALSKRAGNG